MKRYIPFSIYHVVAITIVTYCCINFKSGMCNLDFDILSWIAFSFVSLVLFIVDALLNFKRKKTDFISMIVNFVGFGLVFLLVPFILDKLHLL
jgi:hypothetical protein